jgi:hypothetical protein
MNLLLQLIYTNKNEIFKRQIILHRDQQESPEVPWVVSAGDGAGYHSQLSTGQEPFEPATKPVL